MKARPNYKLSVLDRIPHFLLYIRKSFTDRLTYFTLYIGINCFILYRKTNCIIYPIYRGERKLLYILSSFIIYRCFIELMKVE